MWKEKLPNNCPPIDVREPQNEYFFRLVENNPPKETDFDSHFKRYPNKKYISNECIAKALSILSTIDAAKEYCQLPIHRNKIIMRIQLPPESGAIKQTGSNIYHYSWWCKNQFIPHTKCELIT